MSIRYLAGSRANFLTWATIAVSPAEDALFPASRLALARPSDPFKFGSAAADSYVRVDCEHITNGTFETSTLSGWTESVAGSGTTAETTTGAEVFSGTKALEVRPAVDGGAARYQDITVRAGASYRLDGYMRTDGFITGRVRVKNLTTGRYLAAGGASWGANADIFTHATTTYTAKTVDFTVETYQACCAQTVLLRLELYASAGTAGEAQFDSFSLFPRADFLSVHGHNLADNAEYSVLFQSSPDGAAWTTRATMRPLLGAFYGTTASDIRTRFYRLFISAAAPPAAPLIGAIAIGHAGTLTRGGVHPAEASWQWEHVMPQISIGARNGDVYRTNLAYHQARSVVIPFLHTTESEWLEVQREIGERSGWGRDPVVLVDDSDSDRVIHGRLVEPRLRASRVHSSAAWVSESALTVIEDPMFVAGL